MTVVSVEKYYDALSLVLVAEFAAPIERVWQLWADPRQLERWSAAARSRSSRNP